MYDISVLRCPPPSADLQYKAIYGVLTFLCPPTRGLKGKMGNEDGQNGHVAIIKLSQRSRQGVVCYFATSDR